MVWLNSILGTLKLVLTLWSCFSYRVKNHDHGDKPCLKDKGLSWNSYFYPCGIFPARFVVTIDSSIYSLYFHFLSLFYLLLFGTFLSLLNFLFIIVLWLVFLSFYLRYPSRSNTCSCCSDWDGNDLTWKFYQPWKYICWGI